MSALSHVARKLQLAEDKLTDLQGEYALLLARNCTLGEQMLGQMVETGSTEYLLNKKIDELRAKLDWLSDKQLYWPNQDSSFMLVRHAVAEQFDGISYEDQVQMDEDQAASEREVMGNIA